MVSLPCTQNCRIPSFQNEVQNSCNFSTTKKTQSGSVSAPRQPLAYRSKRQGTGRLIESWQSTSLSPEHNVCTKHRAREALNRGSSKAYPTTRIIEPINGSIKRISSATSQHVSFRTRLPPRVTLLVEPATKRVREWSHI